MACVSGETELCTLSSSVAAVYPCNKAAVYNRRQSGTYKKEKSPIVDEDVFIEHPGKDLGPVMEEVLSAYPEESFCFLNIGRLRGKIGLLRDYFLPDNPGRAIAYAVKANQHRKILAILSAEGVAHFDCASPSEIDAVQNVNPGARILFNQPIKTVADVKYAASLGVRHYTVQTQREITKVIENAGAGSGPDPLEIVIRLKTPNKKARINLSTKYGAEEENVRRMIRRVRENINCTPGISVHTGSQNSDPSVFIEAIKKMAEIARAEGSVKTMNVGGGIPVNYFDYDHFDSREYLETISDAIEEHALDALLKDPIIIIELGRAIVAEAVDLTIPILAVEQREQRSVYFNDGVFTSFSDAAVHGWKYNFRPLRLGGKKLSSQMAPFMLFGRTCDCGDNLGEVYLPKNIREGDYLWVPNAGAYMDSQASRFNGFGLPKYVTYNS